MNKVPCARPIICGSKNSADSAIAQVALPAPGIPEDLTFGTSKIPESPTAASAAPSATP